jgi:ubiquinone/menaquinone biosynthesis C-methylase UbiE
MSITQTERAYIPAAGHHWSLPLYDPITKLLGVDGARRALIEQARLEPDHKVLDVGCGTGTLVAQIARAHPEVQVTGLDSDALPYPDAQFDRVLSSFMFHHLDRQAPIGTPRPSVRTIQGDGSGCS